MSDQAILTIHVNGDPAEVAAGSTVADLVASKGLEPRQVAVEVNKAIVPRAQHADTPLSLGDRVEIVTMVGGG